MRRKSKRAIVTSFWCRIRGKHRGEVGYFSDTGAFWICDNCGLVLRDREE